MMMMYSFIFSFILSEWVQSWDVLILGLSTIIQMYVILYLST